tara:strand:- start:360 stop:569 length:210 start_codon:yes stop_codon:yes gene_type:complete
MLAPIIQRYSNIPKIKEISDSLDRKLTKCIKSRGKLYTINYSGKFYEIDFKKDKRQAKIKKSNFPFSKI